MADPRRLRKSLVVALAALVAVVAVVGLLVSRSSAQDPARLLRPVPLHFAPYQYVAYSGSLAKTRADTGVENLVAAFVVGDGTCTPAWGGAKGNGLGNQRSAQLAADIDRARAGGAEVTVSFGGLHGPELASACQDVDELTAAYRSVVDRYRLTRIDLDIEGQALDDAAANDRRAQAIARLQEERPDLRVWLTLPVQPDGLTSSGRSLVERMRDNEVVLAGVNIMTMNYNTGVDALGAQAVETAEAVVGQLKALYPGVSDATAWQALGITVMIGRNDTSPETLTLQDAREVRRFASARGVGTVSMWSVERDTPCPPGTDTSAASPTCSGVDQEPFEFLRTLDEARP